MKILKFDNSEFDIVPDEISIKSLAFCSVELISEENRLAHIYFECLDDEKYLIKLAVPILLDEKEIVPFLNTYEGINEPSGLMRTCDGVSCLCITDIFRKNKNNIFDTYCVDIINEKNSLKCYKINFTREQMLIIMAYTQEVLHLNPIDYTIHDRLYYLNDKSEEFNISTSKYDLEVLGVEPFKQDIGFGLFNKIDDRVSVLIRLNSKDPDKENLYTIWNLSYDKDKVKIILNKRKKNGNGFPKQIQLTESGICIDPIECADIFIDYIIVNYAINANEPMNIIYIETIKTVRDYYDNPVDKFNLFKISMPEYVNFLDSIYEQITK